MTDSKIMLGDCRTELDSLPTESVQSCITSPPYWGLRDYGTATWKGGSGDCDHLSDRSTYEKNYANSKQPSNKGTGNRDIIPHGICPKCGAIREDDQLGLESSPEKYVASMVDVFRAVKRVLKDGGTLWLNLGDSYCGTGHKGDHKDPKHKEGRNSQAHAINNKIEGLKSKDLVGIPWRVAFALQADGWYLRQDIIWHKPNPMPEPVKDRCTKSHEYIFLMSKSPKYYYDADAVSVHTDSGTSNKRDVWTVNIQPYKDAHFATFPRKLIEPCILAGSKAGDTILDPFTGSGTTGLVSVENGRHFLGVELNPEYKKIAEQRINTAQPMLWN
jgi:site-specific DNA-methyltransferase (cytosine-N4-specific)